MTSPFEQIVPLNFKRRGVQRIAVTQAPVHDVTLIGALGRALWWQSLIASGHYRSVTEPATAEGKSEATVRAVIKLHLLAPDLIEEILAGHQQREFRTLPDADMQTLQRDTYLHIRRAHAYQLALRGLFDGHNPAERHIWKIISLSTSKGIAAQAQAIREQLGITLEQQAAWKTDEQALKAW